MTTLNINYLFDDATVLYILQFTRGKQAVDVNKLVSCTKSVIATKRMEADGELDVQELDKTPVVFLQTNLETFKTNIEILVSPHTTESSVQACKTLAEGGPREVMGRVLPLYVPHVFQHDNELKYKGTVMRFDHNTAALYQGEPEVSNEIEMLVTLFFPEMSSPKK
jgi:hypothetical protein